MSQPAFLLALLLAGACATDDRHVGEVAAPELPGSSASDGMSSGAGSALPSGAQAAAPSGLPVASSTRARPVMRGATGHAWLADTAGDVARSFENALRAIRTSAASCGLALDPEAAQDPDALQLEFVDAGGAARALRRADGPSGCAGGDGWYYIRDGIGLPARIELCPDVCPVPGSSTHVQVQTDCQK